MLPSEFRDSAIRHARVVLERMKWFGEQYFEEERCRGWRRLSPQALLATLCSLSPVFRPLADPIPVRTDGDIETADDVYVLLPGLGDNIESFAKSGFIDTALARLDGRERAAFISLDAHFNYYRQGKIHVRVKDDVVARLPAGKRITAVGVSLGGLGVLMTARRDPGLFDRLVLIAPFLGRPKDIVSLKNGSKATPTEEMLGELIAIWRWLGEGCDKPPIDLLYGDKDVFRSAYAYLAQRAPDVGMYRIDGGHDWRTWNMLWGHWLSQRRATRGAG